MSERLSARDLIDLVLDEGSWSSWDTAPTRDGVSEAYAAELAAAAEKSGVDESVLTGEARMHGRRIAVLVGEFGFLAGSIGRAAADRIVAGIERATREGLPLWPHPSAAAPACRRAPRPSCRWSGSRPPWPRTAPRACPTSSTCATPPPAA